MDIVLNKKTYLEEYNMMKLCKQSRIKCRQ